MKMTIKIRYCYLLLFSFLGLMVCPQSQAAQKPVILTLQTTYPKSFKPLSLLPYQLAKLVAKMSNNQLIIKVREPSDKVKVLDLDRAVSKNEVNMAYSGLAYRQHANPAIALFTSVPFGPGAIEYAGWMYQGGGLKRLNAYLKAENLNVVIFPISLSPTEGAGWFNKKINSPEDLKGLRIRVYGLGRQVYEALGAKPVMMAGHKIYQAFENHEIDAAEFSTPAIDKTLQLYKVTKYYYLPGWHQPSTFLFLYINRDVWKNLTPQYREIIRVASEEIVFQNFISMQDAEKSAVLWLKKKTHIVSFSPEMLKIFHKTWLQIANRLSAQNPEFKKTWDSLEAYRKNYAYWRGLNEQLYKLDTEY